MVFEVTHLLMFWKALEKEERSHSIPSIFDSKLNKNTCLLLRGLSIYSVNIASIWYMVSLLLHKEQLLFIILLQDRDTSVEADT